MFDTLSPYAEGGDNFVVSIIGQALHTGVWDIDAGTLERIPDVVGELPTVANGGIVVTEDGTMTVTYMIRDEAVWSDGVPVSGDDFAFTYKTLVDPAITESRYGAYEVIRRSGGCQAPRSCRQVCCADNLCLTVPIRQRAIRR